jgi:hypothetical protein
MASAAVCDLLDTNPSRVGPGPGVRSEIGSPKIRRPVKESGCAPAARLQVSHFGSGVTRRGADSFAKARAANCAGGVAARSDKQVPCCNRWL